MDHAELGQAALIERAGQRPDTRSARARARGTPARPSGTSRGPTARRPRGGARRRRAPFSCSRDVSRSARCRSASRGRRRRAGSACRRCRPLASRERRRSSPSPATGTGTCAGRSARGRSSPGGRGSARPRSPSASVIAASGTRRARSNLRSQRLLGDVGDVGHHARDVHRVVGEDRVARDLRERDVLGASGARSRTPARRARSRPDGRAPTAGSACRRASRRPRRAAARCRARAAARGAPRPCRGS